MYNIHQEMLSGAQSRGWDYKQEADGIKCFNLVMAQMRPWLNFSVDVVLTDEKIEIRREAIRNA